jgi:glutamine---fructose-6-phosphate transaminase (isomerizing)
MCGIVGILGREAVATPLVEALKRLEYRGYDSAGVATLESGRLTRRRAEGKLKNLEARLHREPLKGTIGIGHTRWATHGRVNETNAHPHATEQLEAAGAEFKTETDTEVVAHLVSAEMRRGKEPAEAVQAALPRIRGVFALAFLFEGKDDLLIGARKGPPLAVGYGDGEMYLGSDAIALAPFTDTISYLEDGDLAVVSRNHVEIRDSIGARVKRPVIKTTASAFIVDKGNHRHFMAKEIHEQPEVVGHTLAHYIDMATERIALPGKLPFDFAKLSRVAISACGTAFYAGSHGCRSRSISHRSSATAKRRSTPAILRSSCRSRARPPIRSHRCTMPRSSASTSFRSSTCRRRRSPVRATSPCRRLPAPKSASPRPRRSPAN